MMRVDWQMIRGAVAIPAHVCGWVGSRTDGARSLYTVPVEQSAVRDVSEQVLRRAFSYLQRAILGLGVLVMLAAPLLFFHRNRLSQVASRILHPPVDFYADKGARRMTLGALSVAGRPQ